MIVKKIFKIIVIILIAIFVIGVVDYFLDWAGVIDIDHEQLPEFIRPIFKD
ncbi:MAG: hypothetical protein Q4F56_02690 [Candidatus Saccharibacteria bacterium]|nr:hypothetical protein [Candidatus Saccharibacteria bacterium]